MRIIGGKFRGKQFRAPSRLPVRPTTDQAKEALFNILSNWYDFDALRVLDLFAGTGNISYEFASRGCQDITAVDQHPGCVKFMQSSFRELGIPATVVKRPAEAFIKSCTEKWDLIFMDPPYGMKGVEPLLQSILQRQLLNPEGTLVLEHPPQESYQNLQACFSVRKYGSSVFSFFE